MIRALGYALTLSAATWTTAFAAPQTPLPVGGSLQLTVPATSFTNDVFIDVPEGSERLTLRLAGANAAQDLDLLVRFESAFPDTAVDGRAPEAEWLFDHAQYLSAGPDGNESIVLSRASTQPLRAGRLFISVVSFANAPATTTLSASLGAATDFVPITVLFDDPGTTSDPCNTSGWNDPAARTPIRGNSGTTLGQQRRLAVQEAARLLSEELRPAVPIFIRGCWDNLPFGETSGTLAQAGPTGLFFSDVFENTRGNLQSSLRFLSRPFTIYSRAVTAHQSGTRACTFAGGSCTGPDVNIEFNLAVDQASQGNRRFDYGFDRIGSSGSSFISTAMHEISHGLGFLGLINLRAENGTLGARSSEYDDVYGAQSVIVPLTGPLKPFLRATDAERLEALTSGSTGASALRFAGSNAIRSAANRFGNFGAPDNYISLHTPGTIAGGSSYSHIASINGGELMLAAISAAAPRTLGLAKDMLFDLGWDPGAKTAPSYGVRDSQYFDPTRSGHGIDIRRVAGSSDLYFMVYYSFDASGAPEWFISLGRIVDGLFLPARNEFGDSLERSLFRPGQTPQTVADSSAEFSGQVRIDFTDASAAPACQTGSSLRPQDGSLELMTWSLGGESKAWCMQPVTVGRNGVTTDFSGVWFDPADPGWGITFLSFPGNGGDGLAAQIYYPDADGRGRWAILQTDRYVPGATYPVLQVSNGYCRTCTAPAEQTLTQIGTVTLNLSKDNGGSASRVSFDITYPGTGGGRFTRTNAAIAPGSVPEF